LGPYPAFRCSLPRPRANGRAVRGLPLVASARRPVYARRLGQPATAIRGPPRSLNPRLFGFGEPARCGFDFQRVGGYIATMLLRMNACGSKHENFASAFWANSLQHTWFVEVVFSLVSP
jgi:hypothetical protein